MELKFSFRSEIIKLGINFDINQSFVVSTVCAKAYCVLLPIRHHITIVQTKTALKGRCFTDSLCYNIRGRYTKSQKQTLHYATTIQSSPLWGNANSSDPAMVAGLKVYLANMRSICCFTSVDVRIFILILLFFHYVFVGKIKNMLRTKMHMIT